MPRRDVIGLALAVMMAISVTAPCPARAQQVGTPVAAPSVQTLLARLSADNPMPREYTANVDLHVKLRMFPFIGLTLHGDSSFKRPGLYHFVFRGVPKAAEKFNEMNYDLGDATKWPDRYVIAAAPQSTALAPVVRLTPKVRGMVKWLDVSIDPEKGHLMRAVWSRFDGGTITLVQTYAPAGENEIVSRQTASIDIPHMKADISAEYRSFVVSGMPVVAGLPSER
jgi:hypothetical protein